MRYSGLCSGEDWDLVVCVSMLLTIVGRSGSLIEEDALGVWKTVCGACCLSTAWVVAVWESFSDGADNIWR